jgi:hypothetical protein
MLDDPVDVQIEGDVVFAKAKERALAAARERMADPMLVSWYDRKAGRFSPPVTCCGDDEPAWLIYARSRGASLAVSVNREDYVFLFADFECKGVPSVAQVPSQSLPSSIDERSE